MNDTATTGPLVEHPDRPRIWIRPQYVAVAS